MRRSPFATTLPLALALALTGCSAPANAPAVHSVPSSPMAIGDPVAIAAFPTVTSELGQLPASVQGAIAPIGQGLAEGLGTERDMDDLAALSEPGHAGIIAAGTGNLIAPGVSAGIVAAGSGNLLDAGPGFAQTGDRKLLALVAGSPEAAAALTAGAALAAPATTTPTNTATSTVAGPITASASAPVSEPASTPAASAALVPNAPAIAVEHAPPLAAPVAQRIAAHRDALHQKAVKARQQRLAATAKTLSAQLAAATPHDNHDGTETRTLQTSVTLHHYGTDVKRNVTYRWTDDTHSHLRIHAHTEFDLTVLDGPLKGTIDRSTREVGVQADGTVKSAFRHVVAGPHGAARVTEWQKTMDADGAITGSGTLSWYAPGWKVIKQLAVTLAGTQATPIVRGDDAPSHASAVVALPIDGEVQARVKDTESGKTAQASVSVEAPAHDPAAL